MQYIGYQYAKQHNIVGYIIHEWLKVTQTASIHVKGSVLKQWRKEELLLTIGGKNPGTVDIAAEAEWTKNQINKRFHQKAYQSAYLRNYFKIS